MNKAERYRKAMRKNSIACNFTGVGLALMFVGFLTVPFDGPWGITILGLGVLMVYGGLAGQADAEADLKNILK